MNNRLIKYAWSIRHEFAKYFFVGFSGVFLDLGTLAILKEKFGLVPVYAVMCNQLIVMSYNFSLNKYWSFKNTEMPHKQIARYLVVAGFNYAVSTVSMYFLNHVFGLYYLYVRLVVIAGMVPLNFIFFKYWVYARDATGDNNQPAI